jgi:SAM-dependent methyltransferase
MRKTTAAAGSRRDLPTVGVITNSAHDVGAVANRYLPLQGAKVLCVGLSELEITQQIEIHKPKSISSLTLWPDHIDAYTKRYELVVGDITKRTPFEDDSFDAIVTLSLLEHINPLESGLAEMRRITRPRGIIASMFGPVWSSAYGHHLYAIDPTDPLLNFSLWDMPAYMHLLWDKSEIRSFYEEKGYSKGDIDIVIEFIFDWDGINRNIYMDYIDNFFRMFQVEFLEAMYNFIDEPTLRRLHSRFPETRDFTTYGAKVVLRNSMK